MFYTGIQHGKPVVINVTQDSDAENPLDWTDPEKDHRPLFILTNRSRYRLGDKDAEETALRLLRQTPVWNPAWEEDDDFDCSLPRLADYARSCGALVYPVYMYDHSGVSISLRPYSDPWDSGCLGFILWTAEEQAAYFNTASPPSDHIDSAVRSIFHTYSQYISGDVYVIRVYNPERELEYLRRKYDQPDFSLGDCDEEDFAFICNYSELTDSCGGFFFSPQYTPAQAMADNFNITHVEEAL